MTKITSKTPGHKNLLQVDKHYTSGGSTQKKSCTKKRVQKYSEPHLEKRMINGSAYYYYRWGIDMPVYLGDANKILQAVSILKIASGQKPKKEVGE